MPALHALWLACLPSTSNSRRMISAGRRRASQELRVHVYREAPASALGVVLGGEFDGDGAACVLCAPLCGRSYQEPVVVTAIAPGSTASVSGLALGDELRAINCEPVHSLAQAEELLRSASAGMVVLVVLRLRQLEPSVHEALPATPEPQLSEKQTLVPCTPPSSACETETETAAAKARPRRPGVRFIMRAKQQCSGRAFDRSQPRPLLLPTGVAGRVLLRYRLRKGSVPAFSTDEPIEALCSTPIGTPR
uniref:PDZ domain-containing protein n=1 Tax=Coccolithus braarudii TaxID=221442 RepID=A0A7S0L2X6_9EUKA